MEKGHALLVEGVKRKDPMALCALGLYYLFGKGGRADPARAAPLLDEAQAAGVAHASFELARLCLEGRGVECDVKRAVSLLEHACGFGHDAARGFLAKLLLKGEVVPTDPARCEAAGQGRGAGRT